MKKKKKKPRHFKFVLIASPSLTMCFIQIFVFKYSKSFFMKLDTNCMLLVFLYSNLLRLSSLAPQTSIVKLVTILELKIYIEKTT